ncbi:MAG: thiamine pyrophosphate-binding protein, partial [Candidatus Dadabacteria bacterium]
MSQIHGGEIIARMLAAEGVDTVFGIIDGTYFGLYSNLAKHGIRLITPRHETSAAHMAGAYSRLTGKLGVCIASNGPGVANILPGVAVENGEGHRVLLITSCRREGIIYPDRGGTFQYFNQVGVIKPMAKWSGAATSRDRVAELLRRALRVSYRGRPGVVHLDVPESIMNGKDKFDPSTLRDPVRYRRTTPIEPSADEVAQAAEMLLAAKLPMIHAGTGIIHAGAEAELAEVAELLQSPVTTSWSARGAITDDHPCCISMVHLKLNQKVRNDADLVLAIGTRFGETDWWGKAPYWAPPDRQKTIQVDIDEDNIGVNKPIDLAVLADAKLFLSRLAARLRERGAAPAHRTEALQRYAKERDASRAELDKKLKPSERGVNPGFVPRTCQEALPDDTVWIYDGGNTVVWSNFFQRVTAPNSVVSTFKFGMLGA